MRERKTLNLTVAVLMSICMLMLGVICSYSGDTILRAEGTVKVATVNL